MEIEVPEVNRLLTSSSGRYDLEGYLAAIDGVSATYRQAIEAYITEGPDTSCWSYARSMAEQIGLIDDMRQLVEMDYVKKSMAWSLLQALLSEEAGIARVLQDMKRQVTGFAIEAGFSGPYRRVPSSLLVGIHLLGEEVCASVRALTEHCRTSCLMEFEGTDPDSSEAVAWHEGEANRLSTELIKQILTDETLTVESKLPLTQLVEEIDRVADYALAIERSFAAGCAQLSQHAVSRRTH